MKSFVVSIICMVLVLSICAYGEPDFSTLSDEALSYLIETAQAELERRQMQSIEAPEEDIDNQVGSLPLAVSEARLVVQSDKYKSLYPDMLQAILVNNSDNDIKNASVAFMAWDANDLPVLLKGQYDINDATYVKVVEYSGINMIPGSEYGESSGMNLRDSITGIVTVKAIVRSYDTFEGETWTNPYYDAYIGKYAGKKLQ